MIPYVPKCRIAHLRSAFYPIFSAPAPLRIMLAIVACFLCSHALINAQGKNTPNHQVDKLTNDPKDNHSERLKITNQGKVTKLKIGSPERKAIMDAMRGPVSKYAKTEVIFTGSVSLYEGWAKLDGHVSPKNGKQFAEEVTDELELDFLAILQKVDGEWKTLYSGWSGDIGTSIEAREKFPKIPEILLPNLNDQATQETNNSFAAVTPIPQLRHTNRLSCASVSIDKKFLVTGDYSGVVKIWNIQTCSLVKSIQLLGTIVAARLSPDLQNLFIIDIQGRYSSPFLRTYSTNTWLLSHELELSSGKGNDARDVFISEDCSHSIVTGGFEGDQGVFLIQPLRRDANGKVKSEQRASETGLLQRFPELRKTPNHLEQFGKYYENINFREPKFSVYNNGEFLVEQGADLEWVLKKENLVIISSPGVKAVSGGGDFKNFRVFAHSQIELRSIDIRNLSYIQFFSPGGIIRAASPSPDGDKFALISDLDEKYSEGKILSKDGQILIKKNISSSLPRLPPFRTLSWENEYIFVEGDKSLSCFTNQWDIKNHYDEAAVCNIGDDQTVIILPIEGQAKADSRPDYYNMSVRDYPSGRERIVHTRDNTLMRPFSGDIDAKAERFAKVEHWKGVSFLHVGNRKSMTELSDESTSEPRGIDGCAFVGNNLVVVGDSSNYGGSTLRLLDATNKYRELTKLDIPNIVGVTFDKKNGMLAGVEGDSMIACYKIANNKFIPLARVLFHEGGYTLFTFDKYYLSMGDTSQALRFGKVLQTYPFEQFDLRLNRPDIILERFGAPTEAIAIAKQLREKRLRRMSVTEEMLQPDFHVPEIEIVSQIPATSDADYVNVSIKASDSKYPLDRLRVYVNNVPIHGKEGELLRDAKLQSLERTFQIKLAAGRNKIQVSVLNSAGAESLYANAEVNCTALRPKPTLYAVAMGVSEYSNPEWNLKYAAKDAKDILDRIRSKSGPSYGEVKELLLTDREVTKEMLAKVREFLSQATIDDTVLIFVAGHGLLDSKYDYYFGTSDIDFDNPSEKGIAFEEFDDLLAEMPCLRKSLLIDTCHAGELDEDEKKALAASQLAPSGQLIAMHPVGARGMSIKPIEGARGKSEWYDRLQGLFVDLRRGSGSTILSSSAGAEYALESSEQQNGLFTYAVLEALDGTKDADANKDGSLQMSELGEYVKKRVAELTNNKQTPNTRRVNLEGDFVLSKSK